MRRSVALTVCALAAASSPFIFASPASAGIVATGQVRDNNLEARVGTEPGSSGRASRRADPSLEECTTEVVNPMREGIFRVDDRGEVVRLFDDEHQEDKGAWHRRVCWIRTTQTSYSMYWVPNADPAALAQQALDSAPLPTPRIAITDTPPVRTLVNMPMWTWIDPVAWAPVTATASADGLTVTVTATPTSVLWNSGDPRGSQSDRTNHCYGPGKAFRADKPSREQNSNCTYTYRHTSGKQPNLEFPLSATLNWHATWTATDGSNGDLGNVSRASTVGVRVGESQALNEIPVGGP